MMKDKNEIFPTNIILEECAKISANKIDAVPLINYMASNNVDEVIIDKYLKKYIAKILDPLHNEQIKITLSYHLPQLAFVKALEKHGTLTRDETGIMLHSYPGLAKTFLSLWLSDKNNPTTKRNKLLLIYYEKSWGREHLDIRIPDETMMKDKQRLSSYTACIEHLLQLPTIPKVAGTYPYPYGEYTAVNKIHLNKETNITYHVILPRRF